MPRTQDSALNGPWGKGGHWGEWTSTAQLPNVSGADQQTDHLNAGDVAAVSGELYICISPARSAASWKKILRDAGTVEDVTISDDVTITDVLTLSGGLSVGSSPNRIFNCQLSGTAITGIGTDAVGVAGTVYVSSIWVPCNKTITGMGVLNGTSVGTDKVIYSLYNSAGTLVANTALAGTLGAVADVFQEIAFVTPYAAIGPARYWVGLQVEGTNHANQRMSANTPISFTAAVAGSFGTLPAITPPTSFTAGQGPFAYLY